MGLARTLVELGAASIALFYLQPLMNEFRLSTLATNPEGLVLNFILMLLIPIIWLIFLFMAILEVKRGIVNTQDGL